MKELRQKTILTIFAILTVILVTLLVVLNVNGYRREYISIERGLRIFDDNIDPARPDPGAKIKPGPGAQMKAGPREFDNMMIMDNEVYTVKLDADGGIADIYSHGNTSDDFDIEGIATDVADKVSGSLNDIVFIGNLYHDDYSYEYRKNDLIVIINNKDKTDKLRALLMESVLIFIILETVIFFVSRLIAGWITRPAEEAFLRQKEFIADASHELKTPLAVIMASADALRDDLTPEENDRYLANISYESDRMNRLITGLLDLSKLEDAGYSVTYKEEDLSRIVEKTCLAFDGVAYERSVSIRSDIEENIKFKCNRDDMEKMISTILDNAVKHSYPDTEVRVDMHAVKDNIVIRIVNKGDPISDEDAKRIFERFYRADRSRSRTDNRYGLGLAIAKKIASNHNGDIKAYSENGDTTFEIVLTG